jgi:hypothetical protein
VNRPAISTFAACLACSAKPHGFSGGADDRWTMPLVGALEDGLLVTPVSIGTSGPYMFAIDPDAAISAIDGDVAKETGVLARKGPLRLDETGQPQPRMVVELRGVEIGSLVVETRTAIVVRAHTFDSAGRRIHGVLGRDLLEDSLVFGVDRDLGLMQLVEAKVWKPPPGAIALAYNPVAKDGAVPRRVVKAMIGEESFDLHLDLGATASQLRDTEWGRAKLVAREGVQGAVVDELGTPRKVDKVSEPATVTLGSVSAPGVAFLPYGDQRFADHEVAGSLGLGFFAAYDIWFAPGSRTMYLTPRTSEPLAKRISRWETGAMDKCVTPGCVTVRLVDPLAGKPLEEGKPHPGVILSLTREEKAGGMPLEVVLEAKGQPKLPLVIANLPPHVDRMIDQLPAEFAGVTLTVVDAGPYPRECPGRNGCVDKLAR